METLYEIAEKHKIKKPVLMKKPPLVDSDYGIEANAISQMHKSYKMSVLAQKYQPISLEFLTMKDVQGYPRFAVYNLKNKTCFIEIKTQTGTSGYVEDSVWFSETIPHFCHPYITKIGTSIAKTYLHPKYFSIFGSNRTYKLTLCQEFMSIIPSEVKEKIAEAKPDMESFAIICESAGWKVNETVTKLPKYTDPLVIGWSAEQSYLIDSFDMTSIEEWITQEFTE